VPSAADHRALARRAAQRCEQQPEPVARVHADIWSELANRGQAVGAHDLWIAATALAHGLGVATRNSTQFDRIAGLRVIASLA
jgi:predicted nucleic acid-binding protein